jgi:hypothetical protein
MSQFALPILGFDDGGPTYPSLVIWKDGTVICGGILGDMSPETLAREKAEWERKAELRQQTNVILLEDWRQND